MGKLDCTRARCHWNEATLAIHHGFLVLQLDHGYCFVSTSEFAVENLDLRVFLVVHTSQLHYLSHESPVLVL